MNIILFGATGMVGQGVLRECLLDNRVKNVTAIGRSKTGQSHPKLREIEHKDLWNYSAIENQLSGFDACFFCLGVASTGMKEEDYKRITCDIPAAAGETLSRLNPNMTMVFVSGAGTDSTEQGPIMWARIKGKAENALSRMPFKAVYLFRPGVIQPMHGIKSRTALYRFFYFFFWPVFPIVKVFFPNYLTSTEKIGKAMINAADKGWSNRILYSRDMNTLAAV
jgi:uncharacterized protein YbjT (DUF2867 family)